MGGADTGRATRAGAARLGQHMQGTAMHNSRAGGLPHPSARKDRRWASPVPSPTPRAVNAGVTASLSHAFLATATMESGEQAGGGC